MKKIYLFLLLGIFLISFTSAQQTSLGIFPQGEDINLIQTCADCTFNNITAIDYPNGTRIISNVEMDKDGSVFNYTLDSSLTSSLGRYKVNGIGDPGGVNSIWSYTFDVTYSGKQLKEGQGFLYGSLLLILIFFFVIILFAINQLPSSNQKDEEGKILSITYLKYLRPIGWMFEYMLVVAILYLTSNLAFVYLDEQLFAQILFTLFRVLFGFAPVVVVVWIIWIYRQMFHDKHLQNLLNRGFFPQGKL